MIEVDQNGRTLPSQLFQMHLHQIADLFYSKLFTYKTTKTQKLRFVFLFPCPSFENIKNRIPMTISLSLFFSFSLSLFLSWQILSFSGLIRKSFSDHVWVRVLPQTSEHQLLIHDRASEICQVIKETKIIGRPVGK